MSNRQKIKEIFNNWASAHPSPQDIFYSKDGVTKTVAEFACELMRETAFANRVFLDFMEEQVNKGQLTIEQIQRAYTHH